MNKKCVIIELLRHVMPYLLKFYTTLSVNLNVLKLKVHIIFFFLGQFDLT
ncbi:hypothetical protein BD770DRAFT_361919 [Pilaira anomala]|nr:hypothetical protein BD770DRAFT_361919 [Pilaira anomala]